MILINGLDGEIIFTDKVDINGDVSARKPLSVAGEVVNSVVKDSVWGYINGDINDQTDLIDLISSSSGASSWEEVSNKPFSFIDMNTLSVNDNILRVNTTDDAEEDNTRPITSSGVNTIVGNINALLEQI